MSLRIHSAKAGILCRRLRDIRVEELLGDAAPLINNLAGSLSQGQGVTISIHSQKEYKVTILLLAQSEEIAQIQAQGQKIAASV